MKIVAGDTTLDIEPGCEYVPGMPTAVTLTVVKAATTARDAIRLQSAFTNAEARVVGHALIAIADEARGD